MIRMRRRAALCLLAVLLPLHALAQADRKSVV